MRVYLKKSIINMLLYSSVVWQKYLLYVSTTSRDGVSVHSWLCWCFPLHYTELCQNYKITRKEKVKTILFHNNIYLLIFLFLSLNCEKIVLMMKSLNELSFFSVSFLNSHEITLKSRYSRRSKNGFTFWKDYRKYHLFSRALSSSNWMNREQFFAWYYMVWRKIKINKLVFFSLKRNRDRFMVPSP